MLNPLILIREPLIFQDKIKIYPPSVKEVVSNSKFGAYYKLLTLTQEDIDELLQNKIELSDKVPTPFEYIMANCIYIESFRQAVREAFQFFCKIEISFLFEEQKIIIGNVEKLVQVIDNIHEIKYLTEEEFFEFQNMIREACGDKPYKQPEPIDPNEDPRIRKIKEGARKRDQIKAKQSKKDGISLSTCLVAICCMGIGLTPLNIGEMSYASVGEIMKVMQTKEKYDIDVRSLLAGADSKKVKPKYWIRNND